jgi:hypothetical protein
MKPVFTIACFILPLAAHAEVTGETLCFSSAGAKPASFEMRTYFDSATRFSSGFVKYKNEKQLIPLVLANSSSETFDKNAPNQETTTWLEVFGGQVTGEYELITQGTEVSSMVYTNQKKGVKTGFLLNTTAMGDKDCKW